jgi:competence protein ComEC
LLRVAAAVFHRVGVAGLVLNFVAIPAMAVVQIAGLVVVGLDNLWPAGTHVAAWCANGGAMALVASSRLVDAVPWLSWRTPAPSLVTVVAFYTSGIAVLCLRRSVSRALAAGALVATAAVIAWAPFIALSRPGPGWLRFTAIDVGQGDALLLQFPTGQSLLMDAGTASGTFDMGERVVAPAIWSLGDSRLTWLSFSHPDLDHIGGAVADARIFAPQEVWEGVPVPADPKRRALRAAADAAGMVWRPLQRGDTFEMGAVRVEVLNPPKPDWERPRTRNDDSLVVVVRYGAAEILLTGDIGAEVERDLPADGDRRPLRVLKVAHHGSRGSSSLPFVKAFDPRVAVVSVGRGNLFGHPAPEVIDRLTAEGARVFRTDRDGAVSVETDGREVRVRTMTGDVWTLRDWSDPS